MSLLFENREQTLGSALLAVGRNMRSSQSRPAVTGDTALRHSGVWACLRLRADLVSMMPVDVYRRTAGVQVEMPKGPVLVTPDGKGIRRWMYSTQFDLDRYGNTFGIITERDGGGRPARIDLVPAAEVTVRAKGAIVTEYMIAGERYAPGDVWHETQFTAAGLPVGLSPIAYAAWTIGTYLSAQEFAYGWFDSDAAPAGHLRNTLKPTIGTDEASEVKSRWKASVANRDVFVTGRDWEYTMNAVPASSVMFLDEMKFGIGDVCRFFGVPGDMIDAETSTGALTYANITQRNLQLLIMNIGPAIGRREDALTETTPDAQYVKLNTDAVLRMDPETRARVLGQQVRDKLLTPSEARELDNRQPFADADYAEFDRLFGNPNKATPQAAMASAREAIQVDARTEVHMPAVDARSTYHAPAVHVAPAEVHPAIQVDARTSIDAGAMVSNVDARTDVTVPERAVGVTVQAPAAAEPALTRKRIETDDKGRITGVIEERA